MSLSPLLLGTLPAHPSLLETITYQFNGLLIVFVVLGALWLLMETVGFVFKQRDARLAKLKAAQAAAALIPANQATPHPSDADKEALDTATLAVIAAAIHETLAGKAHRVVSVTPTAHHGTAWAFEGRRDIFTSHKTR